MKTVSSAFKEAQKAPAAVSVRRVSYKRRYWVEASKAYAWESSWTVLPENEIVSVSPITGKLDTDKLNEFKISNVNLVLKNERRQWKAGKRGGYFGVTDTYPDGFEPYWTKFQIESGYEVAGVATYVPLFVGVATGFSTSAASDTIQVEVRGLEALLENANAEDISTLVTLENMGTGNGSNKDFTTIQPGVGIIKTVYLAGVPQKPGTAYSISQLNDPTKGAKISFTTAPASGAEVRITYRYWKQNQKIEDVVGDLLTAANIPLGNRSIDNVLFPNGVIQNFKIDTQGDWAAGTQTLVDVYRSPGDLTLDYIDPSNKRLYDDFSGGTTIDPKWNPTPNGTSQASATLTLSNINGYYGTVCSNQTISKGTWEFKLRINSGILWFFPMGGTAHYGGQYQESWLDNGYVLLISEMTSPNRIRITLLVTNSYPNSNTITSTDYSVTSLGQWHTFRFSRNPGGKMCIYVDNNLAISVQENTNTTSQKMMFSARTGSQDIQMSYIPEVLAIPGSWVSSSLDCLSTPSAWGNISASETKTGYGSISYSTSTSTDAISWDGYLSIGPGNQITSALKRYLKIKVDLVSGSTSSDDYSVQSITIPYTSSATLITMPTFSDNNVYQAIQKVGSFANYEWGFNESEVFFFRQKQVDKTIDETFDASTNLIEISSVTDGTDRVYSEVQATYGNYDVTVGDDGVTKNGPIAKYGKRRLTIDGGDILVGSDVDVATGTANFFYYSLNKPRAKMKVRTKLMEWLDLSDTVSVTFNDNIPARPWSLGDTSVNFGDKSLYFFGDADQTAKNMLCKVVGYRHDTENKISEFDLEEIL